MKYLIGLIVMGMVCMTACAKEPILEWTLKYMEMEFPKGTNGSLEEASDYTKHKKDFKEKMCITIYTVGFTHSIAKTSNGNISIRLALQPRRNGKVSVYGAYGPRFNKQFIVSTVDTKIIRYGNEIDLGGEVDVERDKKTRKVIRGVAGSFILVVKKVDKEIPQLVEDEKMKIKRKLE